MGTINPIPSLANRRSSGSRYTLSVLTLDFLAAKPVAWESSGTGTVLTGSHTGWGQTGFPFRNQKPHPSRLANRRSSSSRYTLPVLMLDFLAAKPVTQESSGTGTVLTGSHTGWGQTGFPFTGTVNQRSSSGIGTTYLIMLNFLAAKPVVQVNIRY